MWTAVNSDRETGGRPALGVCGEQMRGCLEHSGVERACRYQVECLADIFRSTDLGLR